MSDPNSSQNLPVDEEANSENRRITATPSAIARRVFDNVQGVAESFGVRVRPGAQEDDSAGVRPSNLFDTTGTAYQPQVQEGTTDTTVLTDTDPPNNNNSMSSATLQPAGQAGSTGESPFRTAGPDTAPWHGVVDTPRSRRGADDKEVSKTKKRFLEPLGYTFRPPVFYQSGRFGEEEDENLGMKISSTQDAIVSLVYGCKRMHLRLAAFEATESIMIPAVNDLDGPSPGEWWDFSKPARNLLHEYGSITEAEVVKYSKSCIEWSGNKYQPQEQEWLLCLCRDHCHPDLSTVVEEAFDKRSSGGERGGVVYLWLMLNTIATVDDHVAESLVAWWKNLEKEGLYAFPGENVSTFKTALVPIAKRLSTAGQLPTSATETLLMALSKCSHADFSKMFSDLRSDLQNPLTSSKAGLPDDPLARISMILDVAEQKYISYCLAEEWHAKSKSRHAHYTPDPNKVYDCDNCHGNHPSSQCPKEIDEDRVARNRKARLEKSKGSQRGKQTPKKSDGGGGKSTNRNGYGRGAFGPPKSGEVARKIKGKAYVACKTCGWTTGSAMHTTGDHCTYMNDPESYVLHDPGVAAVEALGFAYCKSTSSGGNKSKSKSATPPAGYLSAAKLRQAAEKLEQDTEDPSQAAAAGMLTSLIKSLGNE